MGAYPDGHDELPSPGAGSEDFGLDVDSFGEDAARPPSRPTTASGKTDFVLDVDALKTRLGPAQPAPTGKTEFVLDTDALQPQPPAPPPAAPPPPPAQGLVVTVDVPPGVTVTPAPPGGKGFGRALLKALLILILVAGSVGLTYYLSTMDFSSRESGQQARVSPDPSKGPAPKGKDTGSGQTPDPNPAVKPKGPDPLPVKPKEPDPNPAAKEKETGPAEKLKDPARGVKPNVPRPFVSARDVYTAIAEHLRKTPAANRRFQRFFTLEHLHNNPRVADAEVERCRSALTALVRRLRPAFASGEARPLDAARTVYALDLRTLGWERTDGWRELLKEYPYGLLYSEGTDEALAERARDAADLAKCDLPAVRADWFAAALTRPALLTRLAPKAGGDVPQPVQAVAALYGRSLGVEEAALELGLRDAGRLRDKIRNSARLRQRGLEPLLDGQRVSRDTWAAAFPDAALELDLAIPYSVVR